MVNDGAPTWDLAKPTVMPIKGMGSADGTLVLANGDYGAAHSWFQCFDIATKQKMWSYPDTFVGVHGSHNAPPPEVGLIRGSYGPASVVKLPAPIGNVWVIPTNVGEWHLLTEKGFYLGRLFQPDPIKVAFLEMEVSQAEVRIGIAPEIQRYYQTMDPETGELIPVLYFFWVKTCAEIVQNKIFCIFHHFFFFRKPS